MLLHYYARGGRAAGWKWRQPSLRTPPRCPARLAWRLRDRPHHPAQTPREAQRKLLKGSPRTRVLLDRARGPPKIFLPVTRCATLKQALATAGTAEEAVERLEAKPETESKLLRGEIARLKMANDRLARDVAGLKAAVGTGAGLVESWRQTTILLY